MIPKSGNRFSEKIMLQEKYSVQGAAMLRAASVVRFGEFDDARVLDRVALDADDRSRRRVVLTGEGGTTFLLDLPQAGALRDGDGLVLDGGAIVRVIGVAEPLAEMTATTPLGFVRLAWHLGNRHADVAFAPGALRVRRDHVLEAMAAGLGASVKPIEAPFDPEPSTPHHHVEADHHHHHEADAAKHSPAVSHPREGNAEFPPAALYRLQAWLSPGYPVGAFSFSSGLEWAIEAGDIVDAPTLQRWINVILADGGGFCDAVFFVHAHRAIEQRDDKAVAAVAELALAFAPSKERHLETTAQGGAFLAATRAAWPCAALDRLAAVAPGPCAYPVAVGAAAAGHGIPLAPALAAYLHALAANLISAGVRLIPLGQTDGQRMLAALEPLVAATAERALATPIDEVGSAAFRADLASLRHETQYTRLFRS
jgi:urease accessory protein